ncbi:Protein Niban 2 [Manis pentadactyla]|nr:Protein Niban 2 [Manis pentadactyla]
MPTLLMSVLRTCTRVTHTGEGVTGCGRADWSARFGGRGGSPLGAAAAAPALRCTAVPVQSLHASALPPRNLLRPRVPSPAERRSSGAPAGAQVRLAPRGPAAPRPGSPPGPALRERLHAGSEAVTTGSS